LIKNKTVAFIKISGLFLVYGIFLVRPKPTYPNPKMPKKRGGVSFILYSQQTAAANCPIVFSQIFDFFDRCSRKIPFVFFSSMHLVQVVCWEY
jgi:hypothetical protein